MTVGQIEILIIGLANPIACRGMQEVLAVRAVSGQSWYSHRVSARIEGLREEAHFRAAAGEAVHNQHGTVSSVVVECSTEGVDASPFWYPG